jgi:hypothetical protein
MKNIDKKEFDNLCNEVARLTDSNDHTKAKMIVAKFFNLKYYIKVFEFIELMHNGDGSMFADTSSIRRRSGINMLEDIKDGLSDKQFNQLENKIMEIIEIKSYSFEELTPEIQRNVLDDHRNWNVESFDWWDSVYSDFKETAKDHGFKVGEIYFSGFGSQGDGAMFEGEIYLLDHLKITNSHLRLQKICSQFYNDRLKFKHSGHYYHENSYSVECDLEASVYGEYSNIDGLLRVLQIEIESNYKTLCKLLYSNLETEFNYLTSDECIKEGLIINNYLFTENGKVI